MAQAGGGGGVGLEDKVVVEPRLAKKLWETYYKNIPPKEERYTFKLPYRTYYYYKASKQLDIDLTDYMAKHIHETNMEEHNFENAIALGYIPDKTKPLWEIYPEHNYMWWGIDKKNWCFINDPI